MDMGYGIQTKIEKCYFNWIYIKVDVKLKYEKKKKENKTYKINFEYKWFFFKKNDILSGKKFKLELECLIISSYLLLKYS